MNKWLGRNFCRDKVFGTEWAYKNIKPAIRLESFLDDNGNVPMDYKFLCYLGRAEFVQVDFDRFGNHSRNFYDRDFNLLNLRYGKKLYLGKVLAPENYKEMIRVAESLARGFYFIRVDLYSVGGRVYVGELTWYPGVGRIRIVPREQDFLLGFKCK